MQNLFKSSFLASGLVFGWLTASAGAAVVTFDFNTAGNTEGFTASTAPANALVTGFKQATGIDGITGVLTSEDVNIDPQVLRSGAPNIITLPAGDKWSTFEIRFRQLSGNPGTMGTVGSAFDGNGTILFFNNATTNLGVGPVGTKTVNGTGAFASDVYSMTLTAEPGIQQWQLLSVDFASAPTLNSQSFSAIRFDPVGNMEAKNFEVDYIRVVSVPEPGGMVLGVLAAGAAWFRRRRSS